jgi:L-threonylcarbamoyladenylate synthase
MKVLKEKNISIEEIVNSLKNGEVIVYPTETSYGLGADASNEQAVNRIFKIKKRQAGKSMLVVMPDIEMAKKYVEWTPKLDELATKYWPGPLTIVAKLKENTGLASGVINDADKTLAFRVSAHPLVKEIAKSLNAPLVSTSANISAQDDPYDAQEIEIVFNKEDQKPDIIIDAGSLPETSPTTIVKILNGQAVVLRQGQLKI